MSRPFEARHEGVCHNEECPMAQLIDRGETIRYGDDDQTYHDGCHPTVLEVPDDRGDETLVHRPAKRRPLTVCPDCHLEHAGGCW